MTCAVSPEQVFLDSSQLVSNVVHAWSFIFERARPYFFILKRALPLGKPLSVWGSSKGGTMANWPEGNRGHGLRGLRVFPGLGVLVNSRRLNFHFRAPLYTSSKHKSSYPTHLSSHSVSPHPPLIHPLILHTFLQDLLADIPLYKHPTISKLLRSADE